MAWEGRPAGPLTHPTPMPRGLGVEVPEPRAVPGLLLLFFFQSCSVFVAGSRLFLQLQSGEPLSSCNGLQSTGPVVVAHRLRCLEACGIFLDQESNPCLLRWQVDSLPLSHQEVLGLLPECPI